MAETSVPADLRRGLAVLAAFAVVSVVLPVVLMTLDVRVTPWWRGSVTGLIVVGLLAQICYIGLTPRTRGRQDVPALAQLVTAGQCRGR